MKLKATGNRDFTVARDGMLSKRVVDCDREISQAGLVLAPDRILAAGGTMEGIEKGRPMNTPEDGLGTAIKTLNDSVATWWYRRDNQGPPNLYHYCPTEGMHGILTSKTLWASSIFCLNDRSEIEYGRETIRLVLKQRTEVPPVVHDGFQKEDQFWDGIRKLRIFVFCFCEKSDLLSQWRAYGSGGGGFCIGFDRLKLIDTAKDFRILPLMYSQQQQQQYLNDLVDHALEIFRESGCPGKSTERYWQELGLHLIMSVLRLKNPVFEEENEWRILAIDPHRPTEFRTSRFGILPYISLPIPADAISELIQGPTLAPEFVETSLQMFLTDCGLKHVEVTRSEIPLRI